VSLPPFMKAKAFWSGVSLIVSGGLALLVFFGVLPDQYLVGSAVVYVAIEAVLKWVFDVTPELRARGLMK
jgi:hypothetical protein